MARRPDDRRSAGKGGVGSAPRIAQRGDPLACSRILARGALVAALLAVVLPAHADDGFAACLSELRRDALGKGITAATFDEGTRGLAPDRSVLELLDFQPEFRTPIWDYLAALVDDERIADGRAMLERWRDTLAEVERR